MPKTNASPIDLSVLIKVVHADPNADERLVEAKSAQASALIDGIERDGFVDDDELVQLDLLADAVDVDSATRLRAERRTNQRLVGIGEHKTPTLGALQPPRERRLSYTPVAVQDGHYRWLNQRKKDDKGSGLLEAYRTGDADAPNEKARSALSEAAATLGRLDRARPFPGPSEALVRTFLAQFGVAEALKDERLLTSPHFHAYVEQNFEELEVFQSVYQAIRANPATGDFLPYSVRTNGEVWTRVLENNRSHSEFVPKALWRDERFLGMLRSYVDSERDLLAALPTEAALDPVVVKLAQPKSSLEYDSTVAEQAAALKRDAPADYAALLDGLRRTGIKDSWRFTDLNALRQLVAIRLQPPSALVPSITYVAHDRDHGGVLDLDVQQTFRNVQDSHQLRYYSGSLAYQLESALIEHRTAGVRMDKLILDAHGSSRGLADIRNTPLQALFSRYADVIAPGAEIVLLSCDAGAGGDDITNPVNAVAAALPQAHVRGAKTSNFSSPPTVEDGQLQGGVPWYVPEHEREPTVAKPTVEPLKPER